jgi:hypothetical protein
MNNRFNSLVFAALLLVMMVLPVAVLQAQTSLSPAIKKELRKKEDSLKQLSAKMVFGDQPAERFRSDSIFVRTFVRSLLVKNSFYYPFDSLNISRLYAPDSTFRIFTWQLKKDEYVYMQKGAIQMNTPDGSLKLFPLFDISMYSSKLEDSIRTRTNWVGAIYYRIIEKEFSGRNYYTLLGFDDYAVNANKKWMEVLHFNDRGEPIFGGPFVSFKDDTVKRAVQSRFSLEYKKEAKTFFNYDPEKDMIIFDHLISETDEPDRKSTYIPDGDFEGFKWINGQWVHIPLIDFEYKLTDGKFPVESTILDDAGNINEQQLEEASRRNLEKANSPQPDPTQKPPATPKKKETPPKKKSGGK